MTFHITTYYRLLLLAVIFGNLWIWRILRENLLIGILLIILSFLLFKQVITKVQKRQFFLLILIFATISFITLRVGFDNNIFVSSAEEKIQQNTRHGFYSVELGKLFKNTISLQFHKYLSTSIYKLERNLFYNLDPNLYFFAAHPRERAGVGEFGKYPWFLLPFFIIGLFLAIRYYYLPTGIYFIWTSLISIFLNPGYYLGPVLFFPLMNILIVLGLIFSLRIVKNKIGGVRL